MVAGHIPAYKPALADKTLIESDYYTKAGKYIAAMVEAGELHYPIRNAKGSELENAIQINIELAVNGNISPEEALANAEKECNRILSKK
jgi:ABC-type glycerol-3-phosphate transport system substrate-binding protein